MNNYIITLEEMQKILNTLGEIPAKHSIGSINILQSLSPIKDDAIKDEEDNK